jgi:predicted transcriptional regulator YdeE
MSNLPPQRYEQGRPMLLAGIRRKHTFATMGEEVPRQWDEFINLGTLPGQVGKIGYGAICGGDPKTQTMEYMCAAEESLASFKLPDDVALVDALPLTPMNKVDRPALADLVAVET